MFLWRILKNMQVIDVPSFQYLKNSPVVPKFIYEDLNILSNMLVTRERT